MIFGKGRLRVNLSMSYRDTTWYGMTWFFKIMSWGTSIYYPCLFGCSCPAYEARNVMALGKVATYPSSSSASVS